VKERKRERERETERRKLHVRLLQENSNYELNNGLVWQIMKFLFFVILTADLANQPQYWLLILRITQNSLSTTLYQLLWFDCKLRFFSEHFFICLFTLLRVDFLSTLFATLTCLLHNYKLYPNNFLFLVYELRNSQKSYNVLI
jgi:hypothetical protein